MTNGDLTGFAAKLRAMNVGDAVTIECTDTRDTQVRMCVNIAAIKRSGANGWKRFSTKQVHRGVTVTRLPDAL